MTVSELGPAPGRDPGGLWYDPGMLSRRLFAAGAWVLIALGLAHLFGHHSLVTAEAVDETHHRLLELMRGYLMTSYDAPSYLWLLATMWAVVGLVVGFFVFYRAEESYSRG